ncbi:hypothetical protein BRARA_F02812 [Brassica rapa]|uniref:Uncharacterized protein n=1 Tax=Brassica campestris TaxID=3711 RepID=A0A397Z2B0_BRACM|nr:hypothetical protein BRARA_F02812 [Brassica rapa]
MKGLIPFLYKAMVMYKREGSFSRLPADSSGIFRTSDLRRFWTDRLGLLKTTPSSPSCLPTRNITKRT